MASEPVFLSALQPNTSVTTYGLPDIQLGNGSSVSSEVAKARRVQQQVQMRMAEKSALPRQNGSSSNYAMSDYGGSSTMKYNTYNPSFSSKSSYMYSGSRTMVNMHQFQRMSVGGGGTGGGVVLSGGGGGVGGGSSFYREEVRTGNYQGNRQQNQMDPETMSMHSVLQQVGQPFIINNCDAESLMSDQDATYNRYSTVNGYSTQMRQGGGSMTFPMQRSTSSAVSRGGGMSRGETEFIQQHSFKGPAHRTISRITNRNRMSMGSVSGTLQQQMSSMDRGFIASGASSASQGNIYMQRPGTLSRAMSIKSMHSVGRGVDVFGPMGMGASMGNLSGLNDLDVPTAVYNLRESDVGLQVMGAAYIQHECYNNKDAKDEVRMLGGIGELVKLYNSESQELQRYATGATRNLIYENMENKTALINAGGIPQLVEALKENDDELHKNITGILWNLSSKETLKEKLAKETLVELTDKVLVPLSSNPDAEGFDLSPSEADIFCNTTGCLRNLSSANEKTRELMRGAKGLVDSLVNYIKVSIENNKTEDKGVENAMCVLRNLSYQIYSEMPQSISFRLDGPNRAQDPKKGEAIGCFTPQSRKAKNAKNQDLSTFTEVARVPKGMEWLWHPNIIKVYNSVLVHCEVNSTTREAAAGALQNITAGDKRWASILSRVAIEQERMMPVLLDGLRTNNDLELRSITGFFRNLSRHCSNKDEMATKVVNNLVAKLPNDGNENLPSSDVVINICGVFNNLVTGSYLAARDICYFNGLQKLMAIRDSHDGSQGKMKAAKAAATVLTNMSQYKKLHKAYKEVRRSKKY
uniref:Plakophilin 3 n=1 Tax=Anabas testudineus TaxID=64144 RepID=A0A7N6BXH7_ANATE